MMPSAYQTFGIHLRSYQPVLLVEYSPPLAYVTDRTCTKNASGCIEDVFHAPPMLSLSIESILRCLPAASHAYPSHPLRWTTWIASGLGVESPSAFSCTLHLHSQQVSVLTYAKGFNAEPRRKPQLLSSKAVSFVCPFSIPSLHQHPECNKTDRTHIPNYTPI